MQLSTTLQLRLRQHTLLALLPSLVRGHAPRLVHIQHQDREQYHDLEVFFLSRHRVAPVDWRSRWLPCSCASVPAPPQPDPHRLRDEDRDDAEEQQQCKGGCRPQQRTVEERVRDD